MDFGSQMGAAACYEPRHIGSEGERLQCASEKWRSLSHIALTPLEASAHCPRPMLVRLVASPLALASLAACSSGQGPASSSGGDGDDGGATFDARGGDSGGPDRPATNGGRAIGGSVESLLFAVVGDTRPPTWDDVSGYPTSQITKIYEDIAALDPRPMFVIGTGDYQFSSTGSGSTAFQQLAMYAKARASFPGPFFPAMGNHECTGRTDSNCALSGSGTTPNLAAFMSTLLAPIRQNKPYYSLHVNAADGSWTSKFVFVAANAWDASQQSWLASALSQPTTYTFLVRHEPHDAFGAPPGVAASEALLEQYPYTLCIVGHSHTYGHYGDAPKEVLFGNGGAPLASKDYGFGLFARRSDGAIVVDAVDWQTGKADSYFHFAVAPDGSPTQ